MSKSDSTLCKSDSSRTRRCACSNEGLACDWHLLEEVGFVVELIEGGEASGELGEVCLLQCQPQMRFVGMARQLVLHTLHACDGMSYMKVYHI